jgi:hypothetical protein
MPPKCVQCSKPSDVIINGTHYCGDHGWEFTQYLEREKRTKKKA